MTDTMVKCGDCKYFVRNGNCGFLQSPEGRNRARKFEHAPFWVWSDCYTDKEQVRANVRSACPTFSARVPAAQEAK